MENTKKHAQTRSLNSSRSNKILGLLQINVQGNVKQDPIKTRAKKTEEKTAFRPKEEKSYVELFDRGEWEDLDACLRKNPLGKNLKRKQPWGNEYIDGNYRPTEHDKSRPSKFRKSLFDCATPVCATTASVHTETLACAIPGSVHTETSACTIPGSVYTETSACTIPGSVYTETSACTIAGSVHTETSACTIPASVHTETSACTIPGSVYTEMSACTIPASVHTVTSACTIPASVHTETSACTIPGSVYTEKSACAIPGSVYTETSVCTIPASVYTETSACTIPSSVYTEMSACTIPASVHTETSACTIPASVHTETSACTIPGSVYTEKSACAIPGSVYTETSVCTIPASVYTETSACTIPSSVYTETSACTIPGSVYTETSACTIAGSVHTETSACTIPASVHTETSACTIPGSVYTEMSACTIPASVHTVTSACTIPASVHTETSACTIPGSVYTEKSACAIPGSVYTETSVCTIPASVYTETSACTIPSSVYTEMSACTIPASVHTETSACTIPGSVYTVTSACTIAGSVHTVTSACTIAGSVHTETSACTIPASVHTETSACTIPGSVYTEMSACTIPASVHTVTSACTIPASVHTETSACTIPGSVYTEKSACAIPGSVYTETSVCTIPASVYTETSACTIPSSVYTEMSACTIPASVHTETSACTIPGSVYTVTSACTIAGSVHTVTSACTIAGSVHTETSACPISASVHTSPVSTYLSTNFETNTWGNISKNFPSTPNCNKYNTKGNWTNIKTTFPESPKSSPVKNSNLKRPNKYHNPLKDLNFTSPITKKMSPVSQHNTNTTPPPCIETINNMPNNSFVIMEIPVSSQFELFKKTNPPNVSSEHNIQQKKICHIDISEPINEEMNSKNKRKWDRKNFCLYCKKLITNFSKHMTKIHSNEESVMKYCAILDSDLKIRKQRRQAIFDELRKQGNFLYNQQVLRESITPPTQSMLLPVKRSSSGTNDRMTSHIHCKVCLGLFSRKTFYRHASQCGNENKNDEEDILPAKNSYVKEKGLELNLCSDQASEILKEKIFPLLRKDQKGIAAVTDPLIVSIASDFLSNHTSNKDKYHVTNKMRDAGVLLLKMKEKDPTILNFQDCFDVKQIDNMISSVQEMSQSNLPSGTVGVVGMPARLSWVIHESCSKIIDNIITNQSLTDNYKDSLKRKVMDFQSVIRRRWKYCISTNAEKTRKINAMKKAVVMPDDHDIKLFLEEITYLEQEFSNKLRVTPSVEHYEHLCEAVIAKLIVLNRRRSGEVANAELEFYINRREGTTSDEVLNQLSHDEKSTLEMFEVFLIPGKIVRAVPILFSKTTAQNIDLIISCRTKLGIPQSNQLLFARPGTENPFIGANVIRKIRNSLQLKKPAHMTATGLRHHCATMSHVISKTLDKEDLAEFMGHTLEIHKKKYRYPLDVIQRGKIGPHLIKLGGVHLNELESANEDIMNEDNCDDVQHWHNNDNEDWRNDNDEDWQPDNAEDWHNDDEEDHHTNIKHKRKTRTRWTEEEKLIVIESFKEFIKSCRNPGKKLCTELILKESLLKNRTWAQVNVLVDNYNKGKVALPMQYQYLRNC